MQTLNLASEVLLGASPRTEERTQGSPRTKRNPEVKVKWGKVLLLPIVYLQVVACPGGWFTPVKTAWVCFSQIIFLSRKRIKTCLWAETWGK